MKHFSFQKNGILSTEITYTSSVLVNLNCALALLIVSILRWCWISTFRRPQQFRKKNNPHLLDDGPKTLVDCSFCFLGDSMSIFFSKTIVLRPVYDNVSARALIVNIRSFRSFRFTSSTISSVRVLRHPHLTSPSLSTVCSYTRRNSQWISTVQEVESQRALHNRLGKTIVVDIAICIHRRANAYRIKTISAVGL